jgi:hypothetical protein
MSILGVPLIKLGLLMLPVLIGINRKLSIKTELLDHNAFRSLLPGTESFTVVHMRPVYITLYDHTGHSHQIGFVDAAAILLF